MKEILSRCEKHLEQAVIDYNKQFDGYEGDVVVSKKMIEKASALVSEEKKADIKEAAALAVFSEYALYMQSVPKFLPKLPVLMKKDGTPMV